MKTYIARKSNHIQEDIERNWSSWNFGEEGLHASEEQVENWKQEAIENEQPFCISGFELWGNDIATADIRELYAGYWVLVDNENSKDGLSGIELTARDLENAIIEANSRSDYFAEGISFDAKTAKLVYSKSEIHIFEINK